LARKQVSPVTTLREIDAVKAAQILGYSPKCRGEPLSGRLLVVPVKQGDVLSTLELIDGDKRKSALAGQGTKACGYWATRQLPEGDGKGLTVLIGEGVATVLSSSAATGQLGIAALSAGNLPAVAKAMREHYPSAEIVLLADLVKATGLPDPHAIEAASIVAGKTAIPDFGSDRDPAMTDFNDMAQIYGAKAVAQAISSATVPTNNTHYPSNDDAPARSSEGDFWPDPQPLVAKIESKPYPLESLPPLIREAVEEVESFVKAPVSMVACSALSTVSLACQPHVDVRRREKLEGPVALYTLVIADSGERKSTCDGFFTKAISDYEEAQAEAAKPALTD
jgi:putative DNA primase/helicase